jgi:DNA-binding response OmpR family regulator
VLVDAEESPEHAYRLLAALGASRTELPLVVVAARSDLERFPWHEVADELVFSGTPAPELRIRLGMLWRRTGALSEATLRLGPLSINSETYQVMVSGRILDLTYKEFELLRFLVQRHGRVFTRSALLQEVWGYNFYGGTRTVDVHIRRLRAKLGSENEHLIETIRGVGYRAAQPRPPEDD